MPCHSATAISLSPPLGIDGPRTVWHSLLRWSPPPAGLKPWHLLEVMHTPIEVTEQAMALVRDLGADCIVALGGGSTTGLGKAIALRTDLPQVVIPTTYAGSEATPILGETEGGRKTTQRSLKVLPEVISSGGVLGTSRAGRKLRRVRAIRRVL